MNDSQSRFSGKLAIYLWFRFFVPLACCLISFSLLFLITDCFDVLQDFLDHDAPFSMMLEFFYHMQPQRLVTVVPMAFLLASMYTFAGLSRHNEVVAIRASGISLVRTSVFIWLTAIAVGFGMKHALDNVVPNSIEMAEHIEDRLGSHDLKVVKSQVLAYRSKKFSRDWIFGKFSIEGEKRDVVVTQFRSDGTIKWEIRADVALYTGGSGWLFEKGQISYYDEEGELLIKAPESFDSRRFSKLNEKPEGIRNSLSPVQMLKTEDIYTILANSDGMAKFTVLNCYTTIYYRWFFPFGCLIALLFGIPLSINTGRGGMFANLGIAVLTVLSFYGVLQGFLVMAQNGVISPFMAGLIPTLGYLVVGGFMMYKKR